MLHKTSMHRWQTLYKGYLGLYCVYVVISAMKIQSFTWRLSFLGFKNTSANQRNDLTSILSLCSLVTL